MIAKYKFEWLIFALFLLFFIFVPNNNQGYDSYSLSISAKHGNDLYHPHHLIYNLYAYLLYALFSFTGLGSMKILSLANSVFAAFSLTFIFKLLVYKSGRLTAIIGTALTGSLFSFWYYATSVEVNMPAIFFFVLALYFMFAREDNPASGWLVYILLCVGMLFHQIIALAGIPILIYDILTSREPTSALKRAHPAILGGAIIYLIVAIEHTSSKNAVGIYKWITQYGHAGEWGKLGLANVTNSAWGKIKTFFGGETVREMFYSGTVDTAGIIVISVMVLVFLGMAYLFITTIMNLFKNKDKDRMLFLSLFLVLGLFAGWWAPADDGFWLYPFIIFIIFLFLRPLPRIFSRIVAIATVSFLLVLNFSCEFIPSTDKNSSYAYRGAELFKRLELTSADLVITNLSQIRLAYEYYTGIHVPTTCMMFLPPGDKAKTLSDYSHRIAQVEDTARVFMFEDEIYPDTYRSYLFSRFSPEDYDRIYQPYLENLNPVDSVFIHGRYVKIFKLNN